MRRAGGEMDVRRKTGVDRLGQLGRLRLERRSEIVSGRRSAVEQATGHEEGLELVTRASLTADSGSSSLTQPTVSSPRSGLRK